MRKLFLLFAASALAFGANAQLAPGSAVRLGGVETRNLRVQNAGEQPISHTKNSGVANKGTGVHKRTYNYVNYLGTSLNTAILDPGTTADYYGLDYMWDKYNGMGVYSGPVLDTISLGSYGQVLHPFFTGFNTVDFQGEMRIKSTDAFTVDSIITYGAYGRNNALTTTVDTLRFAFTYGNGGTTNITIGGWVGTTAANYGVDTVWSGIMFYDQSKRALGKASTSTGPSVVYVNLPLRSTDTGSRGFGVPLGASVPAGNLIGATVTFISGEPFTPYDTVFAGSVTPNRPFKHGMFRPAIFVEKLNGAYPTYTKNNYNSGQFLIHYLYTAGEDYIPSWSLYSVAGGASDNQFPDIDFVISCPTCESVGVKEVSPAVVGNAFPNPANNTVTLPITMKQAGSVNVTLTNLVGQTMATQNLGQIAANAKTAATFSTTGIANGVYFMTVEANGARTTSRFVVAH